MQIELGFPGDKRVNAAVTNRFEEAESLRDKADVMNWTLNELACNITPNLRLDLIASVQAELVRADTMAE